MSVPKVFYKSESTGNDFVMFVDLDNEYSPTASEVRQLCDRHFGLGGDGLIRIGSQALNDLSYYFMDYYNSDGTIANMCGNGVRSVVSLLRHLKLGSDQFCEQLHNRLTTKYEILTRSGIKTVSFSNNPDNDCEYSVEMGKVFADESKNCNVETVYDGNVITLNAQYINIGNEHLVIDLDNQMRGYNLDIDKFDLNISPKVNIDANIEFFTRVNKTEINKSNDSQYEINLRVFERGVGETLSCGTGICATSYCCLINDSLFDKNNKNTIDYKVNVLGGTLHTSIINDSITLRGTSNVIGKFTLIDRLTER